MQWVSRNFLFDGLEGTYLNILERLEGTPVRIERKIGDLGKSDLTFKPNDKWSIQEHIGHLLTMESLWVARLDDFVLGHQELRPWNGTNADTDSARFNLHNPVKLLEDFAELRNAVVKMMRTLSGSEEILQAYHPRLKKNMRLLDHAWFVAEHDDHHLSTIHSIKSIINSTQNT